MNNFNIIFQLALCYVVATHNMKLKIEPNVFRYYCQMTSRAEIKQYAKKISEVYHGYRDAMCQFLQGKNVNLELKMILLYSIMQTIMF